MMGGPGRGGQESQPLQSLLTELDRGQLQKVLLELAEGDPDLSQIIENEIHRNWPRPIVTDKLQPRRQSLDLNTVRQQMSSALGMRPEPRYHSGWYGFTLGHEASELLEQVWSFIRADQARDALEILNVITDECLENWEATMEDDEGEMFDFVGEQLGPAWVEAILSAELTPSEREGWAVKLDVWTSEMAQYGDGSSFDVALRALQEGWDELKLLRILRGEVTVSEHGDGTDYLDREILARLSTARLNVLERQGRFGEYLNLSRADGQVARYTVMLAQKGRAAEAAEYGHAHLERAEDALRLAQALREVGEWEPALRTGERGLGLDGKKVELATWLANLAEGMGEKELAVHAAVIAFQEEQTLASYLRVQELAAEGWTKRREDLLHRLRSTKHFFPQGPIDIFLHEGLINDAIALIDKDSYPSPHLIEQVAAAAIHTHPDWVIRASRQQAEDIMDRKKAEKYDIAARWLAKAKEAYSVAGRQEEWRTYLAALLEEHHRKYKLVPLLKALG